MNAYDRMERWLEGSDKWTYIMLFLVIVFVIILMIQPSRTFRVGGLLWLLLP